MLSSITHTLLYEFHVTGKGSDPTVETVPSPALSEQATDIFRKMVNRTEENAPAPRNCRMKNKKKLADRAGSLITFHPPQNIQKPMHVQRLEEHVNVRRGDFPTQLAKWGVDFVREDGNLVRPF